MDTLGSGCGYGGGEVPDIGYVKLGLLGFANSWTWAVKVREIRDDSKSFGLSNWKREMSLTQARFFSFGRTGLCKYIGLF